MIKNVVKKLYYQKNLHKMQKIIVFFAFLCFNIANFNLYIFI